MTSASAKFICIRKRDKTFLNETLKNAIDRVILDEDFADFDRPLPNMQMVLQSKQNVERQAEFRKKVSLQFLKESRAGFH